MRILYRLVNCILNNFPIDMLPMEQASKVFINIFTKQAHSNEIQVKLEEIVLNMVEVDPGTTRKVENVLDVMC